MDQENAELRLLQDLQSKGKKKDWREDQEDELIRNQFTQSAPFKSLCLIQWRNNRGWEKMENYTEDVEIKRASKILNQNRINEDLIDGDNDYV